MSNEERFISFTLFNDGYEDYQEKTNFWGNLSFERAVRRVLHISSTFYGCSQRIVRPDAIKKLEEVWKEYLNEDEYNDLKLFIDNFNLKDNNNDRISDIIHNFKKRGNLSRFIRPGWFVEVKRRKGDFTSLSSVEEWEKYRQWKEGKDVGDLREKFEKFEKSFKFLTLENKLKKSLWATPPSSMNPFYEIVKKHFPFLALLNRLTYLHNLLRLEKEEKDFIDFEDFLGLKYRIVRLGKFGFLVAGGVWVTEKKEGVINPASYEKRVEDILNALNKLRKGLKDFIPIIEEDDLSQPHKLFLKTRAFKFSIITEDTFNRKIEFLKNFNLAILKVFSSIKSDLDRFFSSGNIILFSNMLLFFCNLFTADSLLFNSKKGIFSFNKGKTLPFDIVEVYSDNGQLLFKLEMEGNLIENTKKHFFTNIRNLTFNTSWLGNKDFIVIPEFSVLNKNEKNGNLNEFFKQAYFNFIEKRKNFYSHAERFYFEKVRVLLQSIKEDDISEREKYFVRSAMVLSLADFGSFFEYDGLNDTLVPKYIHRTFLLKRNEYEDEINCVFESLKKLKTDLEKWSTEENRNSSTSYQCLDNLTIITRFDRELENINQPSPSCYFYNGMIKEKDILAIPVFSHGIVQGVLHLASQDSEQFTYQNRLSIIDYVQSFEEEIFEARMAEFEKNIFWLLNRFLKEKKGEESFYYELYGMVASLLSVNYIAWFEKGKKGLTLKGVLGKEIFENFDGFFKANRESILNDTGKFVMDLKKPESEKKGIKDSIQGVIRIRRLSVPKKELYVLFYHKINPNSKKVLEELLDFLCERLSQIIGHYLEHISEQKKIVNIIGHDIGNAVKVALERSKRLKTEAEGIIRMAREKFYHPVFGEKERKIRLIFTDLKKQLEFINILSRLLRNKEIKVENHIYKIYSPHLGIFKPKKVNIYQMVKSVFFGISESLKRKNITFDYDSIDKIPDIWIVKEALERVLLNLASNVEKYSLENSKIKFQFTNSLYYYYLSIENEAKPLPKKFKEDGYKRLMNYGEKGEQKKEGDGMGLYISKNLCETWGGELDFKYREEDGKGVYKFIISFPKFLNSETNPWEG